MESFLATPRYHPATLSTMEKPTHPLPWMTPALANTAMSAITGSLTKVPREFAAAPTPVPNAPIQRSATSPLHNGLAQLQALSALVDEKGACSLPGVSINFNLFIPILQRAVARGYVPRHKAQYVSGGGLILELMSPC